VKFVLTERFAGLNGSAMHFGICILLMMLRRHVAFLEGALFLLLIQLQVSLCFEHGFPDHHACRLVLALALAEWLQQRSQVTYILPRSTHWFLEIVLDERRFRDKQYKYFFRVTRAWYRMLKHVLGPAL
jgi:hypothetical protein